MLTKCVCTKVVYALADVVDTKLVFILSSSNSMHLLFSQLLCGKEVCALWVIEHPLCAPIFYLILSNDKTILANEYDKENEMTPEDTHNFK